MYRIVKERRAWWPVAWSGAAEDGGTLIENRIELRFLLVDDDAAPALAEQARTIEREAADQPLSVRRARVLMTIASDWRGVGGENGEPLPWGEENIAALLAVPGVHAAAMAAYADCRMGRAEIREGN